MRDRSARCVWLLGGAIALLALAGCASRTDGDATLAKACAAQGLTPGTEAFEACVGRQQLQQRMELERIRQARETTRGSNKL